MCLPENCNLVKLSSLIVMWFVGVYCIHIKTLAWRTHIKQQAI